MTPPSLPSEVFDALPPAVRAYIRHLEARLAGLDARLGQTSANSSEPPSSDPPHAKPAPPKAPSGKAKGGQPGHPKRTRPELPPDTVIELRAGTCDRCSHPLVGDDPAPLRHQVVEIPPVRPHVTESRRHRLACPPCGRVTCPVLPADARGGYGSRVQAVCALLSGAYRVGKRGVARPCGDLFGGPISPAAVRDLQRKTADAFGPVTAAAHADVAGKPATVDEAGWREGRERGRSWVAVTAGVTASLLRLSRARAVLAELLPGDLGVLTADRDPPYDHLPSGQRRVCRAHLRRDFQAMIDRRNARSVVGGDLPTHADILLTQWKRARDGTLTRRGFRQSYLGWVRAEVRTLFGRGAGCGCAVTAGVCRELLTIESALYTFAAVDGVEPTNTAAERALRHAVSPP